MSDNSFARHLTAFFTEYLASERGFSYNTIRSYSNTFVSFLSYMESACHVKPERMELKYVNRSNVLSFLDWLQDNNGLKTQPETNGWRPSMPSVAICNMRMLPILSSGSRSCPSR